MYSSKDIRNSFIKFFESKKHKYIHSSPVVPYDDQTLLFANAGMNQFKDVFLGTGNRDYTRAVNTQKCIRAGGKHNDLEEVGMDGYHHTFFEMLGNWSFGDYYKKEAIEWAWELLTKIWKLPKDRLWATVYYDDDEAFNIWKNNTDIAENHILRFDEKDNFWEMGDTGPCGPCSEIHYDSSNNGCKAEDINAGREDVIEIWNLVFIQYNRDEKGKLYPLPKRHVDTGMGLERVVRIINNKSSNYETDIFGPIINKITEITGKEYTGTNVSSINAIADHVRALTFAICDGAIPSNEGRGYVLRRILRRALRLARKLEYTKPLLHQLTDTVIENFSSVFDELADKREFVKEVVKLEEESFNQTLDRGLELFNQVYRRIKDGKIFPGEEAFKLYDTYGFPIDLTQVIARENGLTVDMKKFDEEMQKQKDRARSARKDEIVLADTKLFELDEKLKIQNPEYDPYHTDEKGIKTSLLQAKRIAGSDIEVLVLKNNPFYSEAGGQVSDTGKIIFSDGYELDVIDSKNNYFVYVKNYDHRNLFQKDLKAVVDTKRRKDIQRNHSATHLVHEALRQVLGSHVKQMGSLVSDGYLRFDFPHFQKPDENQIKSIEDLVNQKITESIKVETIEDISQEEADKIPNVKKFFGEKYGDKVRVVIMDEKYSVEYCGGTHVQNTSDIGLFKIIKEESISSGIRRIFAKTGKGILDMIDENIIKTESILSALPEKYHADFKTAINSFKGDIGNADFRDTKLLKQILEFQGQTINSLYELREKYLEDKKSLQKKMLKDSINNLIHKTLESIDSAEAVNGIRIISGRINTETPEIFKEFGEEIKKKLKKCVCLFASVTEVKINLVCIISDELKDIHDLHAGKLISKYAKMLGGGGGGKPNIATAGGRDINKLDEILKLFEKDIKEQLTK